MKLFDSCEQRVKLILDANNVADQFLKHTPFDVVAFYTLLHFFHSQQLTFELCTFPSSYFEKLDAFRAVVEDIFNGLILNEMKTELRSSNFNSFHVRGNFFWFSVLSIASGNRLTQYFVPFPSLVL